MSSVQTDWGHCIQVVWESKMKYYSDKNRIYRTFGGMLEAFSAVTKEWHTVSFKVSDMDIENRNLTEISEEQAWQRIGNIILENLDSSQLRRLIKFFRNCRKIDWTPARVDSRGILILGFPNYPQELFVVLDILGGDEDFFENEKKLPRRIEKMNILQIRTFLTVLSQRERFCEGTLADAVEDGSLLKLLTQIEILRKTRD